MLEVTQVLCHCCLCRSVPRDPYHIRERHSILIALCHQMPSHQPLPTSPLQSDSFRCHTSRLAPPHTTYRRRCHRQPWPLSHRAIPTVTSVFGSLYRSTKQPPAVPVTSICTYPTVTFFVAIRHAVLCAQQLALPPLRCCTQMANLESTSCKTDDKTLSLDTMRSKAAAWRAVPAGRRAAGG